MTRGPITAADGLLFKSLLFACCSLQQLQAAVPPRTAVAFGSSATNGTGTVTADADAIRRPLEIFTAVIMPADLEYPACLSKVMPVLEIAVRDLYTKGVLRETDVTFRFVQKDDKCEDMEALRSSFDLSVNGHVDLFLGPICDYGVDLVARMIKYWNAPMLTTGAFTNDFSGNKQDPKSKYFLLVRTGLLDFQDVADVVVSVLDRYSWRNVLLVYETEGYSKVSGKQTCFLMTKTLVESFKGEAGIQYDSFDLSKNPQNTLTENLRIEASDKYSIIVLCANPSMVREILLAADELNMIDSGEYVFFNIELFSSLKNASLKPWESKNDTVERNERAKKAYTALLTVTARTPNNAAYHNFSYEVKKIAKERYNYTYGDDAVSTSVTAFYDAVLLYGLALNETLAKGGNQSDGAAIVRAMWNKTFPGITGDVHIDANGDRIADYSLLDMDPVTHEFKIVANYIGVNQSLEYVDGVQIHWAGGRNKPPPDTPSCGFDNSNCQKIPVYLILSIILSMVVVVSLIASAFIYRCYFFVFILLPQEPSE